MLDKLILRWFLWSAVKTFYGVGMGPSGTQANLEKAMEGIGKFGTSVGEDSILKSQKFWSDLLSGDMTKISSILGPEMSAVNKQGQQMKKTASEFGTRSGGTAAVMSTLDTNTMGRINDMIAKMIPAAASNLGNMGEGLLSTGESATGQAFGEASLMQQLTQNKKSDIFNSIGKSIQTVALIA